jgi:hypothetical protein
MRYRSPGRRLRTVPGCVASTPIVLGGLLLAALLTAPDVGALEAGSRISGSFGFLAPADDDMHSTYGMMPALGVRWTSPMGEASEFFLGTGYGWDTGDPYYDEADFVTDDRSHVRTIPIEIGVRMSNRSQPRRAFYLGAALEYLWIREETPVGDDLDGSASGWQPFSGWGWGGKLLAGPEWRIADGRFSLGGEVSLEFRSLIVHRGHEQRRVELSGLGTQVIFSTRL